MAAIGPARDRKDPPVKIGAKSRTWALTEQGRLAATAGRTVWLPVVDVDQISDADWQAMAAARLEADNDFTCPRCGMTSHNPNDVAERYCGNCHDWTGLEDWPFLAPDSELP
jgi:ribosomal protein S27AE